MAALNEIQITDYVYETLSIYLRQRINGNVYHKDCRPANSNKEDAEIVFSAANAEQIQEGFVYINIYCKDVDSGNRKVLNRKRLTTILSWDKDIAALLNLSVKYKWHIEGASSIIAQEATKEHFASIKLRFSIYNK